MTGAVMTDVASDQPARSHWDDDALGRRDFAEYMTEVLTRRFEASYSAPGRGALCIALDGDWGEGKSFFVSRWALDVAGAKHPVVNFDAWQNDLTDDPLVGFMAVLQESLGRLTATTGKVTSGMRAAKKQFGTFKKQASRAVLPAMAVIGKGLLKKATGIDLGEVIDAGLDGAADDVADAARESSGEALEKFFELALKSHSDKRDAIAALRESMEELLTNLASSGHISLPMFIFIDELDRCRPDYGLRLLEGTKHLFDVQGVCFVFSTNMAQLAASAKAVYGESFDSYRYFKRFFACEYSLPPADRSAYAGVLLSSSIFASAKLRPVWPLPLSGRTPPTDEESFRLQFSYVADFHGLDLRAMRQVLELAENAAAQLDADDQLHPLYLFHLASLYHRGKRVFDSAGSDEAFRAVKDAVFEYRHDNNRDGDLVVAHVTVTELLKHYHRLAIATTKVFQDLCKQYTEVFPAAISRLCKAEVASRWKNLGGRATVSTYPRLVAFAGDVTIADRSA